jgi:NAD(P)-dependent dehydrogenase (short-subunit alcohol dehydrogenase family)
MFSLSGKITLITGGGSGIGLATAQRFTAAGARVVVANRSDSSNLVSTFGGEYVRADVSEESQVKALIDQVVRQHGRIDVLVNSAGVIADPLPITDLAGSSLRRHFDVNTMGIWATTHYAALLTCEEEASSMSRLSPAWLVSELTQPTPRRRRR